MAVPAWSTDQQLAAQQFDSAASDLASGLGNAIVAGTVVMAAALFFLKKLLETCWRFPEPGRCFGFPGSGASAGIADAQRR